MKKEKIKNALSCLLAISMLLGVVSLSFVGCKKTDNMLTSSSAVEQESTPTNNTEKSDDSSNNDTKSWVSNLFAVRYQEIAERSDNFEASIHSGSVRSGYEEFISFADSYEIAIDLLEKGFTLGNGVLFAHVQRLISSENLEKLEYDATNVEKFLKKNLSDVFGDRDTYGSGLITKIEDNVDKNGKIYNSEKKEIASYKNKTWSMTDEPKEMEELGVALGMTYDEIMACVRAVYTYNDINAQNTETIIGILKESKMVYTAKTEKKNKAAINLYQVRNDMKNSEKLNDKEIFDIIKQLKEDKTIITVEISDETSDKQLAKELVKLGILKVSEDKKSYSGNVDEAKSVLKTFGLSEAKISEKLSSLNISK